MNIKVHFQPHILHLSMFILCFYFNMSVCGAAQNETTSLINHKNEATIVSDIEIHIKKNGEDASVYKKMAEDLITIEKDKPFNKNQFEESINALKLCRKFRSIDVDSEEEPGKIKLKFKLSPFKYIRDIHIEGNAPLFEKEIFNAMSIYVGDVFDEKKMQEQTTLLKELYKNEGFYSPHIEISWEQNPSDESYYIFIQINKGPHYRLDKLQFHDNRKFSDFHLKMKIKAFRIKPFIGTAGRFVEKNFEKDIKKLQQFYWEKNFPEVEIRFEIKRHTAKKTVDINVYVKEGPKYKIKFKGHEKFDGIKKRWTLNKDIKLKSMGNINNSGFRKSIKNIQKRYHDAGYLETKVRSQEKLTERKNYTKKQLILKITEGPRSQIRGIEIRGNKSLSTKTIKKQMLTRKKPLFRSWVYNPDIVSEDLYAIESLYLKNGFLDAKINKKDEWDKDNLNVKFTINITEGPQTIVKSIETNSSIEIKEKRIRKVLHHKIGEPLQKYMIKNDENELSAIISEMGYPHVIIETELKIDNDNKDAHLIFKITEGPLIKMGNAYYSGNFRTKKKTFDSAIGVVEGEPFSIIEMLEGQRDIRNIGIFNSVKFKTIGLKEKKETINLFAQVEEKKPYFLEFGSGYDSDKKLFLKASAGNRNFMGTGREISIHSGLNKMGYDGKLALKNPRFLGSDVSSETSIYAEKIEPTNQIDGERKHGISVGFRSLFPKNIMGGIEFGLEQTKTLKEDPDKITTQDDEKRTTFTATPSINYDTRNSFMRPQKGSLISLSTKVSKGVDSSISDLINYIFDARYFYKLSKRITIASILRFEYIEPYGTNDEVPETELLKLGGIGDIRGYGEDMFQYDSDYKSVGGQFSANGSIEARIYLGFNFELTTFYDVGKLSNLNYETEDEDSLTTTGLGLRYLTPIGPMGVMWGYKLDRKPKTGSERRESPDQWHISIGYSF